MTSLTRRFLQVCAAAVLAVAAQSAARSAEQAATQSDAKSQAKSAAEFDARSAGATDSMAQAERSVAAVKADLDAAMARYMAPFHAMMADPRLLKHYAAYADRCAVMQRPPAPMLSYTYYVMATRLSLDASDAEFTAHDAAATRYAATMLRPSYLDDRPVRRAGSERDHYVSYNEYYNTWSKPTYSSDGIVAYVIAPGRRTVAYKKGDDGRYYPIEQTAR